ncbi:tudor domain protein, partial [Oesophagostomum dentatum]
KPSINRCSDDDSWGGGVPADTRPFGGNSRFSAPFPTNEPRRQSAEMYPPPRREDRYARPPSPPPNYSSAYNSAYDDREDRDRSDYKKRDDFGRSRFGEGEDRVTYDSWKNTRREQSSLWEEPPRPTNGGGYDDYRDGYTGPRRRITVPPEPKKFERRHRYLMNEDVPRYESVILTHFVGLDEFYLRSLSKEKEYQTMLNDLRDDYKGALDDAVPQLWMKGDGAAVRYEHRWQRGVVRRVIPNAIEKSVEVFLVDVGKTVTISSEQMLPLHDRYHTSPYAICCSIGFFDIIPGVSMWIIKSMSISCYVNEILNLIKAF